MLDAQKFVEVGGRRPDVGLFDNPTPSRAARAATPVSFSRRTAVQEADIQIIEAGISGKVGGHETNTDRNTDTFAAL